jgi:outer membrane biosynthesis protein TonB
MPVVGPRFLIEAAFLVAVAVGAGFARLGALTIILVMAGAWLLVASVEWMISRAKVRAAGPEAMAAPAAPLEEARQPPAVRTVEPAPEPTLAGSPAPSPVAERGEPEPASAPEPEVSPAPTPTPEPEIPEIPAEPAPPETPPEQPRVAVVAAVPQPEPEPVQPQPPAPAPAAPPEPEPTVVAFTPRSLGVPRQWNLWELERIARDQSGTDTERDEERSFLLMYLREFADADGVLPTSFDAIVRESFGDVLDAVGA